MDIKQKKLNPVPLLEYFTYKDLEPFQKDCERKKLKSGITQEHYCIKRFKDGFKTSRRYKSVIKLDCVDGKIIQIKIDVPLRYNNDVEEMQDFKTFEGKYSRACIDQLKEDCFEFTIVDSYIEKKYQLKGSHVSSIMPLFEKELAWNASKYEGDINNIWIIHLKYRSDKMTFLITYLNEQYMIMDILVNAEAIAILDRLKELVVSRKDVTTIFGGWDLELKEGLQKLFPNAEYGLDLFRILLLYDKYADIYHGKEKNEILDKKIDFNNQYRLYFDEGEQNKLDKSLLALVNKTLFEISNMDQDYYVKTGSHLSKENMNAIFTFTDNEKLLFFKPKWTLAPIPYHIYFIADKYAKDKHYSTQRLRLLLKYHSDRLNSKQTLNSASLLNTTKNFAIHLSVYQPERMFESLPWPKYMIAMADAINRKLKAKQDDIDPSLLKQITLDHAHLLRKCTILFIDTGKHLDDAQKNALLYIVGNIPEDRVKKILDRLKKEHVNEALSELNPSSDYYDRFNNHSDDLMSIVTIFASAGPASWKRVKINGNDFIYSKSNTDPQDYYSELYNLGTRKNGEVYTIIEKQDSLEIFAFF